MSGGAGAGSWTCTLLTHPTTPKLPGPLVSHSRPCGRGLPTSLTVPASGPGQSTGCLQGCFCPCYLLSLPVKLTSQRVLVEGPRTFTCTASISCPVYSQAGSPAPSHSYTTYTLTRTHSYTIYTHSYITYTHTHTLIHDIHTATCEKGLVVVWKPTSCPSLGAVRLAPQRGRCPTGLQSLLPLVQKKQVRHCPGVQQGHVSLHPRRQARA